MSNIFSHILKNILINVHFQDSPAAGSQYFILQNDAQNNYYHMIKLQKPLEDKFKVGKLFCK